MTYKISSFSDRDFLLFDQYSERCQQKEIFVTIGNAFYCCSMERSLDSYTMPIVWSAERIGVLQAIVWSCMLIMMRLCFVAVLLALMQLRLSFHFDSWRGAWWKCGEGGEACACRLKSVKASEDFRVASCHGWHYFLLTPSWHRGIHVSRRCG